MSEEEIKQEIEQVGYKEFYRYYIEAHKLAKQYSKELQQKENIIKEVREYIKENTKWYDKELGLVEMEGYETDRIPVIYKYGLLDILDKGE